MRREFFKYLLVLASISILTMYVEMVVLPSLPTIERQFNVSQSQGSWILSSETLVGLALAPLVGRIADSRGRKEVLLAILAIYTCSVVITAWSPNFAILLLSRSIQGIGLSINPLAYTILRERLSKRELPTAQGIIASTFAVGAAVSIPIGSYIAQYYYWQLAYQTATPLLILVTLIASRLIPNSVVKGGQPVDWKGIFVLSSSFVLIGVSITEAPYWGWTSLQFLALLFLGFVVFFLFVAHVRRTDNPIIDPGDFRNPNVAVPLISSFVTGFGLFLTFQSLVFLLELPKPVGYDLTIFQAGLTMAPISLVLLVAGPLFGSSVNRIGYKRVIMISSVGSVALITLLSWVVGSSLWDLMVVLVTSLFFISGMNVTRITLLLASTSEKRMATITGTNTSMRLMGNTLGPVVAGAMESTFRQPLLLFFLNGIPVFTFIPSLLAFKLSFITSALIMIAVVVMAGRIKEEIRLTDSPIQFSRSGKFA